MAISNNDNDLKIYYISSQNIEKYNLPSWVKGCNSVNNYHPTVLKLIKSKNIKENEIFCCQTVKCRTLYQFMTNKKITELKFLKIDTEGHDTVILNKFIDDIIKNNQYKLLPKKIQYESNILSNQIELNKLNQRLKMLKYKIKSKSDDTILELSQNCLNFMIARKFLKF